MKEQLIEALKNSNIKEIIVVADYFSSTDAILIDTKNPWIDEIKNSIADDFKHKFSIKQFIIDNQTYDASFLKENSVDCINALYEDLKENDIVVKIKLESR